MATTPGVANRRRHARFIPGPDARLRRRPRVAVQNLESERPVELLVVRQVDRAGAATPELAHQPIAPDDLAAFGG